MDQGNDAQRHNNQDDQQGDGVAADNAPEFGNEDARKQCCDNEEADDTGFGQKPKRRRMNNQRLAELPHVFGYEQTEPAAEYRVG